MGSEGGLIVIHVILTSVIRHLDNQTFESSFSAVSKPSFASKHSLVTRCFTTWRRRRIVEESRFLTGLVDISDEILRIVIFQEMVFMTFRQKKSFEILNSY